MRIVSLLFAVTVLLNPLADQSQPAVASDDAESAAAQVEQALHAPAVLAAAAALLHGRIGSYPTEPFELLGSPEATMTGARSLLLSDLKLTVHGDTLQMRYTTTPSPSEPAEQVGGVSLYRSADEFKARLRINRRADPDFGGEMLPLATAGSLRVRRAQGQLCLNPERLTGLFQNGRLDAFPFCDEEGAAVTFVGIDDGEVVATTARIPTP